MDLNGSSGSIGTIIATQLRLSSRYSHANQLCFLHRAKHSGFPQWFPQRIISDLKSLQQSWFFVASLLSLQVPSIHPSGVPLEFVFDKFIHHKSLVIFSCRKIFICVTAFISHTFDFFAILVRSRYYAFISFIYG